MCEGYLKEKSKLLVVVIATLTLFGCDREREGPWTVVPAPTNPGRGFPGAWQLNTGTGELFYCELEFPDPAVCMPFPPPTKK